MSYCLYLGCHLMISSTKRQRENPCHYILNIMQYYMALKLTNDIHLQLGFPHNWADCKKHYSPKLNAMTDFSSSVVLSPKCLPQHTSLISHWPLSYIDLLSCILIGPRDSWLIINLLLLNLSYSCMLCDDKITWYID